MMRKILVALTCAPLLSCGASVLDADTNGIWLQESMFNVGNPDTKAEEHCRQFGKRAEYQSTLKDTGKKQYMMPIRAYKCL